MAIIETEGLTKVYGGRVAVDSLSFSVQEGEIFGFLGPNGAGKTTTLLMLLGLTEPTRGTARVFGLDPVREPIRVKSMIAYLQENMGFYRDLNARQTLRYIAELNRLPQDAAEMRIESALKSVGLDKEAEKKSEITHGECASGWALPRYWSKNRKWLFWMNPRWDWIRILPTGSWN